ncbi:hypothetical protein LEMA_P003500.1 [Plenodomus lingam JN3]|uniref:Thymidylate kinase-like domain-containing protein n=1 Tax=Leptosphaeria maculans (strain JN3 / isolate v23.1.3 / race Av1-4-5-6-7-8) TaxID=985895 RepID=E5AEC4_LEPMJ|nr:hypothetical protein LEMA_P003500.1 [Plenodomus lingam JN3]CBY01563.1 hypothetical protein LEMA_P003500.1 [Plenodomus lingam JN3]
MPRGRLIVFEGLDRAGKSTQCAKLVADLRNDGRVVRHLRFPGMFSLAFIVGWQRKVDVWDFHGKKRKKECITTRIGQMIDSYLSGQSEQEDHVIHLLFSANRWEVA